MTSIRHLLGLVFVVLAACGGGSSGSGSSGTPSNILPRATISAATTTGYAPLSVSFDGSQSTDSDGSITSYTWHMGDGSSYATSQVSHTFQTFGPFTVSLTVTDNDGATAQASVVVDVYAQAAGFYNGTIVSNATGQTTFVYAQIGSNHQVYAADYVDWITVYSGVIDVVGDAASATLQAEIWDLAYVFSDGSQIGSVAVSGTITPRVDIDGTFVGVGDGGPIVLTYWQEVSERPASLAEVSGVWSWTDGISFTETMTIDPSGAFIWVATDGCSANGTLELMDPNLNEYRIEYDITCPPGILLGGNGIRQGLARIEHADLFGYVDDWLAWDVTYMEGPLVGRQGAYSLARPPAVAASSSMQALGANIDSIVHSDKSSRRSDVARKDGHARR